MRPHQGSLRSSKVKIAFIIARTRNNVVVLFGTLKVQSFKRDTLSETTEPLRTVVTFVTWNRVSSLESVL